MRLRGHQLDGFNAALKSGDAAKAHQELQKACARAEGIVPFASASGSARLLKAAKDADWMQVVLNQGPPCFHLAGERFCLRAERWDGHKPTADTGPLHEYVSLESLLRSIAPNAASERQPEKAP